MRTKNFQTALAFSCNGGYIIPRCESTFTAANRFQESPAPGVNRDYFCFLDHLREAGKQVVLSCKVCAHRPQVVFFMGAHPNE